MQQYPWPNPESQDESIKSNERTWQENEIKCLGPVLILSLKFSIYRDFNLAISIWGKRLTGFRGYQKIMWGGVEGPLPPPPFPAPDRYVEYFFRCSCRVNKSEINTKNNRGEM